MDVIALTSSSLFVQGQMYVGIDGFEGQEFQVEVDGFFGTSHLQPVRHNSQLIRNNLFILIRLNQELVESR